MRKIIKVDQQYLPATCYVLTQQKHPSSWKRILQPYVAEIKRFTNIYRSKSEAIRRLIKLSDHFEIELIQAASYYHFIQQSMNLQTELESIEKDLNQYTKQLSHLHSNGNIMSTNDSIMISKHYSTRIKALQIRQQQLIEAIKVEGVITISPTQEFPKNNC